MSKIYSNSDNHHVKATIVYANEDYKLFHDPEYTKPVLHEDGQLYELFVNGMIVSHEETGELFKPVTMHTSNGIVEVDTMRWAAADVELPG